MLRKTVSNLQFSQSERPCKRKHAIQIPFYNLPLTHSHLPTVTTSLFTASSWSSVRGLLLSPSFSKQENLESSPARSKAIFVGDVGRERWRRGAGVSRLGFLLSLSSLAFAGCVPPGLDGQICGLGFAGGRFKLRRMEVLRLRSTTTPQ
jgi:hypothetical protein